MPTSRPTVAYSFQGSRVWVDTEHRQVGNPLSPESQGPAGRGAAAAHLPPLLLLLLLREDRVDPPDLGEHGAVAQTKAQTQEPEARLGQEREQGTTVRKAVQSGATGVHAGPASGSASSSFLPPTPSSAGRACLRQLLRNPPGPGRRCGGTPSTTQPLPAGSSPFPPTRLWPRRRLTSSTGVRPPQAT